MRSHSKGLSGDRAIGKRLQFNSVKPIASNNSNNNSNFFKHF
ncbi:MAG: hypothetical protein WCD53_28510 [Microcoleus sp.]